ncbi:uncharacterized protein [Anabrus simplex]|uniref:uncharacterized protein n=1 Tax=Anabrus simplex TaxID=316456 RepID=UPI0035A2FCD1
MPAGKRLLSGATPEEDRQTRKRPTVEYARIAKAGIRMAIVPVGYPDQQLSEKQVEAVEEAITNLIDELPEQGPIKPQFLDCYLSRGAAVIIAENNETVAWLSSLVTGIQPWEGARLTIVGMDKLLSYKRVMVWIPGQPKDNNVLLGRMARQNHGLNPASWRVYDRKEEKRGVRLVVSMDSREVEKVVGKKIFCGVHVATFTLVEGKRDKQRTNPTTDKTETSRGEELEPGQEPGPAKPQDPSRETELQVPEIA